MKTLEFIVELQSSIKLLADRLEFVETYRGESGELLIDSESKALIDEARKLL